MANPFMDIFSGALGEANTQRTNTQQLDQALRTLLFQKQLEQSLAQQQQEIMMKRIKENPEMFGMGSGQPSPSPSLNIATQRPQIPFQQAIASMPENQRPAMSLASGGMGTVSGQPVDLKQVLQRMLPPQPRQPAPSMPSIQPREQQQQPFRMLLNPSTGMPERVANPAYESPVQEARAKRLDMGNSTRIRQEFINRPEVKDYMLVKTKAGQMDALLKGALSGNLNNKVALQQGIITLFNKITDPQSVVRESEYARTPENVSIVNRISGAFQKLQQGGAGITNDDLKALVIGAKILANESGKIYQGTLDQYKALAGDLGIDEKFITRGMDEHQDWGIEQMSSQGNGSQPKQSQQETPSVGSMFNGEKVIKVRKIR